MFLILLMRNTKPFQDKYVSHACEKTKTFSGKICYLEEDFGQASVIPLPSPVIFLLGKEIDIEGEQKNPVLGNMLWILRLAFNK